MSTSVAPRDWHEDGFTRKYNGWYMWVLRAFAIVPVSLFFVKYVPIVFNWLFT